MYDLCGIYRAFLFRQLRLVVLSILALCLCCGERCLASESEDARLLQQIADGYSTNLERLHTWRGTAVRKKLGANDESGGTATDRIEFVCDRGQAVSLWKASPLAGEGSDRVMAGMNEQAYKSTMSYSGSPNDIERPRYMVRHGSGQVTHGIQLSEFDPIWMLIHDVGLDGKMDEHLRGWARLIEENPPPNAYDLSRTGDIVTLTLYGPDPDGRVSEYGSSTYVFDCSKGYSIVEERHRSSVCECQWKLEYEERNGVFVPRDVIHKFDNRPNKVKYERHITIDTDMLNDPVDANEISPAAMGLRRGDIVVDHTYGGLTYTMPEIPTVENIRVPLWADQVSVEDRDSSVGVGASDESTVLHSERQTAVIADAGARNGDVRGSGLGVFGTAVVVVLGVGCAGVVCWVCWRRNRMRRGMQ